VRHVVDTFLTAAENRHWTDTPERPWWVPSDDPHRARLGTQQ
jgi:hypothetical protein